MSKLTFYVALMCVLSFFTISHVHAQCADCGADRNKQEREQMEKDKQKETISEKELMEKHPKASDKPQGKTTDVRRVGVPNGSTLDKN
ncbi:hypothetical protein [Pseudomonas putida]|uniref:hypothetical protein n=1 Tax=Pseudomonas putida TaxID=303 RepID=UPI00126028E6|nr:hypothetical protein [Pseudomonas putida]